MRACGSSSSDVKTIKNDFSTNKLAQCIFDCIIVWQTSNTKIDISNNCHRCMISKVGGIPPNRSMIT